jgi:hypothetical protein
VEKNHPGKEKASRKILEALTAIWHKHLASRWPPADKRRKIGQAERARNNGLPGLQESPQRAPDGKDICHRDAHDVKSRIRRCLSTMKRPHVQFTAQEANTIGAASGVAQNALYSAGNAWSCDPFGAAGPPSSLEPIIRLEAMIDARIDKALARLVGLQEYERVTATYSPPLIPV